MDAWDCFFIVNNLIKVKQTSGAHAPGKTKFKRSLNPLIKNYQELSMRTPFVNLLFLHEHSRILEPHKKPTSLLFPPAKPLKVIINAAPRLSFIGSLQKIKTSTLAAEMANVGKNLLGLEKNNNSARTRVTWASMHALNRDFCRLHLLSSPWVKAKQLRNDIISLMQGFWRFPNFFGLIFSWEPCLPIIPCLNPQRRQC